MVIQKLYNQELKKQDTIIDIINLLDLFFAILGVFVAPIFYLGVILFTSAYIFIILNRQLNNTKLNKLYSTKYKLYTVHIIGFILAIIDLTLTLLITLNLTVFASGIRFVVVFGRNITRLKAINNLKKLIPSKIVFKKIKLNKSKEYSVYKKSIKRRLAMIDKLKDIKQGLIEDKEALNLKFEKELESKKTELSEKYEKMYEDALSSLEQEVKLEKEKELAQIDKDIEDIEKIILNKQETPIKVTVTEDLSNREDADELINVDDDAVESSDDSEKLDEPVVDDTDENQEIQEEEEQQEKVEVVAEEKVEEVAPVNVKKKTFFR